MATRGGGDKAKNEGLGEIFIAFSAMTIGIFLVIWIIASNEIVWASLSPMLFIGSIWKLIPSDFTIIQWNTLVESATRFGGAPNQVGLFEWLGFVNKSMLPIAVISFLSFVPFAGWILIRKRSNISRQINPGMLLSHNLGRFTGIAPVLKIRKKIVDDKLPEWRVQYSPEDVFRGKAGCPSMIASGEFDREIAQTYFWGITGSTGEGVDKRLKSRMLGWQVVNLLSDRNKGKPVIFSERLSNEGKALLGLWASAAFGADEGKAQHVKYRDMLNMSALGSPTGKANLTLAEPLFQQYKKHPDVMRLFAVHHWEHTFLFSLLQILQRKGRYTTAEVLWLRPTNREMFFSLNSCGSKVPHMEAAATFSQVAYERMCASMNRLPLVRDENNQLMHFISIDRCIDGLEADYKHWAESTDDNKNWWSDKRLWKTRDAALVRAMAEVATPMTPPEPAGDLSEFDKQQQEAAQKTANKEQSEIEDEIGRVFGTAAGDPAAF